jgi:hypothetical protein
MDPLQTAWSNLMATLRTLDGPDDPAKIAALKRLPSEANALHGAIDARVVTYGEVPW